MFEVINGKVSKSNLDVLRKTFTLPTVPISALYSKIGGVFHWQACVDHQIETYHQAENIQVQGSQSGLSHNLQVVLIVANISLQF